MGALVNELHERDLVDEVQAPPSGAPGRPSPVVTPRADHNVVLAVELLVDTVTVAAVGLGGTRLRTSRRDWATARPTPDQIQSDLAELTGEIVESLPSGTALFGIGVAVPGLVQRDGATIAIAPNLGWTNVCLPPIITQAMGIDAPVSVQNEANLGALAESRRGAAQRRSNVLYVSGEIGVGGGMISSGTLVGGATGFAGEIGHLPVNPDGEPCHCGASGCFETEIGEPRLLRRAGYPADGGRPAIDDLVRRAADGDAAVLAALAEHGRWLGYGLSGLINVLDPGIVVLGALFARVHRHLEPTMRAELDRRVISAIANETRVVASTLGSHSSLLGAAELAWDRALADPTEAPAVRL